MPDEIVPLPDEKPTVYFRKEIASQKLYLANGTPAPFENFGSDTGLLSTSDESLIGQLRVAIKRRMGGVVEITPEQFADVKKNPPVKRSAKSSLGPFPTFQRPSRPASVAAAATSTNPVTKTAPLKVPETEPMLAQMSKIKARKLSDIMETAKNAPPK